jgi:hypothetical protein
MHAREDTRLLVGVTMGALGKYVAGILSKKKRKKGHGVETESVLKGFIKLPAVMTPSSLSPLLD